MTHNNTNLVIVVTDGKSDEAWNGEEKCSLFFFWNIYSLRKKSSFQRRKHFPKN